MSFSERAVWSNGDNRSRRSLVNEFIKDMRKEHRLQNFEAESERNTYKYMNKSQNSYMEGLGFQNVLEGRGVGIQSVIAAFRRQDEEWKVRCEAREREWRESERSFERRQREDQVISNYLSKLESYHKNKIKDKTLEQMDFEAEGRELEAVLGRAKVKAMDRFGRDELVGVHPSRGVNAVGSTDKVEIPDEGSIGAVVRQVDESFDTRANVSTASEAIGEPGNTEESKDEFSCLVCDEVPKVPVDVPAGCVTQEEQQVLNSEVYSHELADTGVGNEVAASVEELLCANSSDVVGEYFSGSAPAPCLPGKCTVDVSTVLQEPECADEIDVDAGAGINFTGESSMPAVIREDQHDDFEEDVVIEE